MSGPIAVFGAGGQLGRELMAMCAGRGVEAAGFFRADADIADLAAVAAALSHVRPRLVVNAAAFTAVDKAESQVEAAEAGNVTGAENIARAAAGLGLPIVHFSTDYVFDGNKAGAYVESDPIAPIGVYARTKAEGEARVRAANPHHVIVRTAWVYGLHGANFLKTMLRLAGERDELRVVADQHGCPTATADLAEAVLAIDHKLQAGAKPWGTYHFASGEVTSWHGFASAIVAAQAPFTGKNPKVTAITTGDYPTPARRPPNSALGSEKFTRAFGYAARPWRERTAQVVGAVLSGSQAAGLTGSGPGEPHA